MKKTIIILTTIFMLSMSVYGIPLSTKDTHYLQFVSEVYKSYIGNQIFIETTGSDYIYQGRCLAISDYMITIKYIAPNVQILTIPMHQVKKFYRMDGE